MTTPSVTGHRPVGLGGKKADGGSSSPTSPLTLSSSPRLPPGQLVRNRRVAPSSPQRSAGPSGVVPPPAVHRVPSDAGPRGDKEYATEESEGAQQLYAGFKPHHSDRTEFGGKAQVLNSEPSYFVLERDELSWTGPGKGFSLYNTDRVTHTARVPLYNTAADLDTNCGTKAGVAKESTYSPYMQYAAMRSTVPRIPSVSAETSASTPREVGPGSYHPSQPSANHRIRSGPSSMFRSTRDTNKAIRSSWEREPAFSSLSLDGQAWSHRGFRFKVSPRVMTQEEVVRAKKAVPGPGEYEHPLSLLATSAPMSPRVGGGFCASPRGGGARTPASLSSSLPLTARSAPSPRRGAPL
eukprot:CAMPEP_0170150022 /NCGR_PEP_ID=MMETSP0033_2-20121228/44954_1 /TAXON_ID=195969 /ORGANISM="Dolichomastix tenuilepis, Strain CCMP3274" /LENGTH=351 /DNA_ID=CAMNT_0010387019 /DNA_START=3 /DNA_END=1055 /DNA_ORIENTATION=+